MRFGIRFCVTFLSLLTFVSSLHAEPDNAAKPSKNYSGVVIEVDSKAKTMVVGQEGTDLAMRFNVEEAAFVGFETAEVKAGDKVTVQYQARTGLMYAVKISKGIAEQPKPKRPMGHP